MRQGPAGVGSNDLLTSPALPTSGAFPLSRRGRLRRALLSAAAAAIAALLVGACGSSSPSQPQGGANRPGPESMVTEARDLLANPAPTIAQLKALGVDRVHVPLYWANVAPKPGSVRVPHGDLTNPAAYPASGWAPYDAVIRDLKAAHIGIDLAIVQPVPRWAEGKGAPDPEKNTEWRPSAKLFGQFVRAAATRYSGHYKLPGSSSALPKVGFWSIWNEPDLGINIAPEAIDHSKIEVSPRYYRAFVNEAWSAFGATGHAHDTILIGELAPAGIRSGAGVGNFNSMPPLRFLRALYCVDANYHQLRGIAATERGCPATAAESAKFVAENPGLFHASGMAVHPYPQGLPPNEVTPNEPDYAELAAMGNFAKVIDRLQRVYGSSTKFPIWDTEFGYQTTPPDVESGTVSPTTAAYYLNWAEYITWQDPRLKSFDQYLLVDPPVPDFDTGLLTSAGAPKPAYAAFRMPLYLPVTKAAKGSSLIVWGDVRPAPAAADATHRPQTVKIQFSAGANGPWRTVQRVPLTNRHGYFEIRRSFPGSGNVRLAWTPPHAAEIYSRVVAIKLH